MRGSLALLAVTVTLLTGCGQKYYYYDEYVNETARGALKSSKNVWVRTVDYNNDLITAELKRQGFTIDASKADFIITVHDESTELAFTVHDAKTNQIIFSKVAMFVLLPSMEDRRTFILSNLNLFLGVKA